MHDDAGKPPGAEQSATAPGPGSAAASNPQKRMKYEKPSVVRLDTIPQQNLKVQAAASH